MKNEKLLSFIFVFQKIKRQLFLFDKYIFITFVKRKKKNFLRIYDRMHEVRVTKLDRLASTGSFKTVDRSHDGIKRRNARIQKLYQSKDICAGMKYGDEDAFMTYNSITILINSLVTVF